MSGDFTRIFSDIHYGERACRVRTLSQLRPLLDGPSEVILNGDTLDTRPGPRPDLTAQWRAEVTEFFSPRTAAAPVTFLTGNHDPDLSSLHSHSLAGGEIFLTHGDICYENIVPWSKDAPLIRQRVLAALAAMPPGSESKLETRLIAFRRAVATLPQRQQSERNLLRFLVRYATDSVWPPSRLTSILRAWREFPGRAESIVQRHRPAAKFILCGHTHRPGFWRRPSGITVINTGAFAMAAGAMAVDVFSSRLVLRRIVRRGGEFHAGASVAEFTLAGVAKPCENATP